MASQRQTDQQSQRNLLRLQSRIEQLEAEVNQLEQKLTEIEKEKPNKLTPRSSNNRSILRGLD